MGFFRIQGLLTAAALLAVLPAHGQNAPQPPAAPMPPAATQMPPATDQTPPATTLTPPGSGTSVPLLPDASAPTTPGMAGGGLAGSGLPGGTLPSANLPSLSLPTAYSGLGGLGQGSDLTTLLAGSASTPLTLTLGDLDSHWRRLTISGNLDLGSISQVITSLMGSAGVGIYYTKGYTATVGDVTYLIAYRAQPKILSMTGMADAMAGAGTGAKPPAPERLTAETPLALSLLNLQTAGSLTDIRPFNLQKELADSAAAVHAYNSLVNSFGAAAMSLATTPHPAVTH